MKKNKSINIFVEKGNCSTCKFSKMIDSAYYECRRYPPKNSLRKGKITSIDFTIVEWDMWCGEYLRKESEEITKL